MTTTPCSTRYGPRDPLTSRTRFLSPTKSNIAQVQEKIFEYDTTYNEAATAIVNLISSIILTDNSWVNRLGFLKRDGLLGYGSTVEEIAFDLIKAEAYDLDAVRFFETHKSEVYAAFHTLNSQLKYTVTVFPDELRKAFFNENGLSNFVTGKLNAVAKSAEYDEYNIMLQLIAEAYKVDGITRIQTPIADIANPTADELKNLSVKIRETAKRMTIVPNTHYNRKGVPAVSRPEDLILITTPNITAAQDVNVLADAFNIDRADFASRVVEIDQFPIPGVHAMLVDRSWFIVGDTVRTMRSFDNPENLGINFWLHKWTIYSVSPFAQAVIFGEAGAFEIPTVTTTTTGIEASLEDENGNAVTTIKAGGEAKLNVKGIGTITPAGYADKFLVPNEYTVEVNSATKLSSRTYVSPFGVVRVQDDIPAGTEITITVTSAFINPSTGEAPEFTDTVVFTTTA